MRVGFCWSLLFDGVLWVFVVLLLVVLRSFRRLLGVWFGDGFRECDWDKYRNLGVRMDIYWEEIVFYWVLKFMVSCFLVGRVFWGVGRGIWLDFEVGMCLMVDWLWEFYLVFCVNDNGVYRMWLMCSVKGMMFVGDMNNV